MKKTFKLDGLECAHCAAKMEVSIKKLDGVKYAAINFMMSAFTLEADDDIFEDLVKKSEKAIKKIESDCSIVK